MSYRDTINVKEDYKKTVTIKLWASTHKKLRAYAVEHDTNVSALFEQWAREHLEKRAKI